MTTTYVYGADGARLKRTVGGSTTLTVGPIEVRGYGTGSETLLLYPTPEVRLAGSQPAYLHRDQVGSIQLVTDGAGADGEHATYQPFGEARTIVAGTIPAETKGFVGERYDAAPELQYLNARYYDPELSLFTSPDWFEVTDPGVGTNRYAYAGNSPVNQADPGGNVSFQPTGSTQRDYYDPDSDFHRSQVEGGPQSVGTAVSVSRGDQNYSAETGYRPVTTSSRNVMFSDRTNSTLALLGGAAVAGTMAACLPCDLMALALAGILAYNSLEDDYSSTRLYRAVDQVEFGQIMESGGRFMPSPYGSEGKYFAFSSQGAHWEGLSLQRLSGFSGPYRVVGTTYPEDIVPSFEDRTPYGMVESVIIPNDALWRLSPAYPLH